LATFYSQGTGLFSTLTNWDTNRAGGGSNPASVAAIDDQTFVIQPGHVITFDVEDAVACDGSVSGWTTGLAAVTIEGTTEGGTPGELTLSRVNNSANRVYHLAIKNGTGGTIAGTNTAVYGKFSSGTGATATTPMPTGAMHVIQQYGTTANTALVDCTYLDVAMYAAEPVQTSYILSAGVGTGATALPVIAEHVKSLGFQDCVVVSPDVGNMKRATAYAQRLGVDFAVIDKRRLCGDATIATRVIGDVAGRTVLLFDDMITTAGTASEAIRILREHGSKRFVLSATHAVLAGPAVDRLANARVDRIVTTDTIPVPAEVRTKLPQLTVLTVADMLGEAIRRIHLDLSISAMFQEGDR